MILFYYKYYWILSVGTAFTSFCPFSIWESNALVSEFGLVGVSFLGAVLFATVIAPFGADTISSDFLNKSVPAITVSLLFN
jgi:hypothetical protein